MHHLGSHDTVNADRKSTNALQDASVSGGAPAKVVLGLQAVDRDANIQPLVRSPFWGDLAEGAGHKLDVDAAFLKLGQKFRDLSIADERIAAHDGKVQRAMGVYDAEDPSNQLSALKVGKGAEPGGADPEVTLLIGIASGAAKRTLARDLDR